MMNFAYILDTNGTTRPGNSIGTSVTPVQNAQNGTYSQVLTALSYDCCGLWININSAGAASALRDMLVTIGVDPAGGTSYNVLIPNLIGRGGSIATETCGNGVNYYFPIWIKAGSTVAARASVNNATVGTVRVWCRAFGLPSDARSLHVGTRVEAIGVVTATSEGTSVTSGTTAEGAWASLGTTANDNWWFQAGMCAGDGTIANGIYFLDLAYGDGSNKDIIISDQSIVASTTTETFNWGVQTPMNMREVKAGTTMYGRLQCSGTVDTDPTVACWGLGG